MTLWLILAAMTAAALLAVIWPLIRRGRAERSGSDIDVYRDQLSEIDRDRAAGLIDEAEVKSARVEIARRLLAAAAQPIPSASDTVSPVRRRRTAAAVSLLTLPILAACLYSWLGSPDLATAQSAGRHSNADAEESVENLVAKVEAHLQRNPADGRGWEILAPVYMQLNRYSDSVTAWQNTLQLLGESAERDANLGEALTAESNGVVTADAKAAFIRAMTLDETNVTARYFLGLAAEQDGQTDKAAKIWRDLIATAPAGAFWLSEVRAALARVEGTAAPPSDPSAAQMAAAAKQPPEQQAAMIQNMVDRLAARLQQDGSDVDGWVRLVRSYNVLGDADKARGAAADARTALAGDPGKLEQLDAALKQLAANAAAALVPPSNSSAAPMEPSDARSDHQGATMQQMIERLAVRLSASGSDPEGWLMLVRSYQALGDKDKVTAAVGDARRALAGDSDKLERFNAAIRNFKIGE